MNSKARDAQVVKMAKQNIRPAHIAKELKVDPSRVYTILRAARNAGEAIPDFSNLAGKRGQQEIPAEALKPSDTIKLTSRLMGLLRAKAERKGQTANEIAQSILEGALLGSSADLNLSPNEEVAI